MGRFSIVTHVLKNKVEELTKQDKPRIDLGLPLNLKIGTFLSINETDFVLNDELLTKSPGTEHVVVAIGKFKIDEGIDVYRFYLQGVTNKEESILQISINKTEPVEFTLYRLFDEIEPTTADEWATWLNEPAGLIGFKDFIVENKTFNREREAGKLWVDPFEFTENVITDKYGDEGMVASTKVGTFIRYFDEIYEMLLIEHDKISDNKYDLLSSRIGILTGIDLNKAQIDVRA